MPIMNSKTGKIRKDYSIEDLTKAANLMRGYDLVSLAAAKSGHSGGTLSIMDITAALYLHVADHDPEDAFWSDRDRIVWSAGHKAPSLYLGLGMAGYFDVEEVVTLRKLYSPFQGHPHWTKLDGIEASTGSLGQGLSLAVGMALAARLDERDNRVFCLMGDGEQQEGQIWEAVMEAGHYKLDSVCGIIDKNRLQIDGWVEDVMNVDPLVDKYKAFNWNVIEIDGHDMREIVDAFAEAKTVKGKPTLILAHTVKGKGVDFMEDVAGWHGKPPNIDEMWDALKQLGLDKELPVKKLFARAEEHQKQATKTLEAKQPKFSKNYFWNETENMKVDMDPTRKGFGRALAEHGDDKRIVCLGADISGSITISQFYEGHEDRMDRWLSMGIAEQSATGVCAGLAKEGKLPVFGTYGVFASGRNLDQIRTTVCYGEFNVMIAGAHGGVSVGPDGATHQALEELYQMCGLPNMNVEVPCDAVETKRATEYLLFEVDGPKYVRFAREATPVVTDLKTPYTWGKANVIRFRGVEDEFKDAFEHELASKYRTEGEDLAIIACGPSVPEAMRAAWILKEEYRIDCRIVNVHTVKPLDTDAIVRAAAETGVVVTAEEHQVGGFGNQVAAAIASSEDVYGNPVILGMIGVKDRFGESGAPWELVKEFEVSAEHIAAEAKRLYDLKVKRLVAGVSKVRDARTKSKSAGRRPEKQKPARKPQADSRRAASGRKPARKTESRPARKTDTRPGRRTGRKPARTTAAKQTSGRRPATAKRAAPARTTAAKQTSGRRPATTKKAEPVRKTTAQSAPSKKTGGTGRRSSSRRRRSSRSKRS
jgi:transketolase